MGFVETSVVVYLRELLYSNGFKFPVVPVNKTILITELWREFATIIMLFSISVLTGKTFAQRFVFFLYSFAIWDIFYYIFLKVILNWPASVFDFDILFLLPVPWVGPVLAPCIISLTMILLTFVILNIESKNKQIKLKWTDWIYLISGSVIMIISFCTDYISILTDQSSRPNIDMLSMMKSYIPQTYHWWIFIIGEIILIGWTLLYNKRYKAI